jgi:hypothetical protein
MRLLSFLELVETALRADGVDLTPQQVSRHVNYEAGLARMQLPDGVSLVVQNFNLANGQLCLKGWWTDAQEQQTPVQAFFDTNTLDWKAAARQIAAAKPGDLMDDPQGEPVPTPAATPAMDVDLSFAGFRSAV